MTSSPMLSIRLAIAEDWADIAMLHANSWRAAYAHIYPEEFLKDEADDERRSHWYSVMHDAASKTFALVARIDTEPVGFSGVVIGKDPQAATTLDNLHVKTQCRGQGVGRALLALTAQEILNRGHHSMCLWVYDDNAAAIGFYERLGGEVTDRGIENIYGGAFAHTQYCWQDLPELIEACKR